MQNAIKLAPFILTILLFFCLNVVSAQPDESWSPERRERFNDYMKDMDKEAKERKERYDREKSEREPKSQESNSSNVEPLNNADKKLIERISLVDQKTREEWEETKIMVEQTIRSVERTIGRERTLIEKGSLDFKTKDPYGFTILTHDASYFGRDYEKMRKEIESTRRELEFFTIGKQARTAFQNGINGIMSKNHISGKASTATNNTYNCDDYFADKQYLFSAICENAKGHPNPNIEAIRKDLLDHFQKTNCVANIAEHIEIYEKHVKSAKDAIDILDVLIGGAAIAGRKSTIDWIRYTISPPPTCKSSNFIPEGTAPPKSDLPPGMEQ